MAFLNFPDLLKCILNIFITAEVLEKAFLNTLKLRSTKTQIKIGVVICKMKKAKRDPKRESEQITIMK